MWLIRYPKRSRLAGGVEDHYNELSEYSIQRRSDEELKISLINKIFRIVARTNFF